MGESTGEWRLAFQWCQYVYDNGESEYGYRFIWRRPDGSLQPARGQARIASIEVIEELIRNARNKGWGDLVGD
jgi:hypothetical protein